MNHDGGRLELRGDSQIAAPLDYNLSGAAGLDLTAAAAASGNVDIVSSTSPLTGNVPAGISIDVRNATLRSLTSFTNAGTITLDRVHRRLRSNRRSAPRTALDATTSRR